MGAHHSIEFNLRMRKKNKQKRKFTQLLVENNFFVKIQPLHERGYFKIGQRGGVCEMIQNKKVIPDIL